MLQRLWLVSFLVASLNPVAVADLKGDVKAVSLANDLVESIGGKDLWSGIRSLHVIERSRSVRGDGIIGEFWRDLQIPQERYTLTNRHGLVSEFWWDSRGVWQYINGESNDSLPAELHAEVASYWAGEIYVMYHRLAKGDQSLFLKLDDDHSFTVFDKQADRRLGTFWVNDDGELYRWRHDDGTEYVYGPYRKFGDISFPDWGSQVDGSWSFYYVEVRWSAEEPQVSFEPPG